MSTDELTIFESKVSLEDAISKHHFVKSTENEDRITYSYNGTDKAMNGSRFEVTYSEEETPVDLEFILPIAIQDVYISQVRRMVEDTIGIETLKVAMDSAEESLYIMMFGPALAEYAAFGASILSFIGIYDQLGIARSEDEISIKSIFSEDDTNTAALVRFRRYGYSDSDFDDYLRALPGRLRIVGSLMNANAPKLVDAHIALINARKSIYQGFDSYLISLRD